MKVTRFPIAKTIIILVLFMLQFLVVPAISVNGIVPNLILVYLVLFAIERHGKSALVLAFISGLLYSIIFGGAVGLFSLVMVVAVFAIGKIRQRVSAKSIVCELLIAIFSVLVIEFIYCILLLIFGIQSNLFASLILIALPSFFYDLIPLLIFLSIVRIFIKTPRFEVAESQPVDIV
ncbi:MAG: rod shape-determining protein MreD [Eggerthellaceae bacterium]|nr:rod shape-determining protein MreD [Eggerthellaceae bacterium]